MTESGFTIGKYEILDELGFGGMGTVYKARDPLLDREVALKTMFTEGDLDDDSKRRFLREARSVARLQHPNIVTVYEFGDVDGKPFIAMEILDGLGIDEAVAAGVVADLGSKLRVVVQLCDALDYAHSRGVIHRDVKPSNVVILEDGTVKVLDFGVARVEGGTFITEQGVVLGTPSYMAPEQFTQVPVDGRVDMWAVGVLLHELVTGRKPFDSKTVPSLIYKIIHGPLPPISADEHGLPRELVDVIQRALAKDPNDRFERMQTMAAALRTIVESEASRVEELSHTVSLVMGGDDSTQAVRLLQAQAAHDGAGAAAPQPEKTATFAVLTTGTGQITGQRRAGYVEAGVFGEQAGLQVVAVSPDESVVVVGGVDGSLRLWDLETRMKLATLRSRMHLRAGHAAMTTALCFTPDGSLLAAGHLDGAIYVWDVASGLEIEASLRHEGAVSGLAFSADAGVLVSGGADSTVKCWEMPAVLAGEARRMMRRQPAEVTSLAVAGEQAVTGHANRAIRVHEIASGRLVSTIHGHTSVPCVVAIAPGDDLLLTGSRDGAVRVFSIEERLAVRKFEGHTRPVSGLAVFPDGRTAASVARDNVLVLWDMTTGAEEAALAGAVDDDFVSLAVLNQGQRIVCGLADGRLRLWLRA